jgi:8-oxo-dGTP pyrophosphatase MutT (NUDIX family)
MLKRIDSLPTDHPIAGVHVIPVTDDGYIVMGWNREEAALTSVGGRIEPGETHEQALGREAHEEAGITLREPYQPIASWYWESTHTYTVFYTARVAAWHDLLPGFENTGRVIFTPETARSIISQLHHDPGQKIRLQLLTWAEEIMAR